MKLNSQDGYDAIILILWLTNVKELKNVVKHYLPQ